MKKKKLHLENWSFHFDTKRIDNQKYLILKGAYFEKWQKSEVRSIISIKWKFEYYCQLNKSCSG